MTTMSKLVSMLQTMRPAYSQTERLFNELYLEPVYGQPDEHGNYIKVIGDAPRIVFTAHTDTVHRVEGIQKLKIEKDIVTTVDGSCLGADCTTGLWLQLCMIEAGVEGVYVAHAAEEIGGVGSAALVADNPYWLADIDACISFDRFGTESVITHQSGGRTASDEFAKSLALTLELPLKPDPWGTYTDSLEYAGVVPECTNISVGYYDQHTKKESQDLQFAQILAERLCKADWSALTISRDPTYIEQDKDLQWGYRSGDQEDEEVEALERLVLDRPGLMAQLLFEYGFTLEALCDELSLSYTDLAYYQNKSNQIGEYK